MPIQANVIQTDTYWVTIFIAGPIEVAKQLLREECWREGLCVTIEPTLYIFSGGEEIGYKVGFINYPRFPKTKREILDRALAVAEMLRLKTFQRSFTVQTPGCTEWYSDEPESV